MSHNEAQAGHLLAKVTTALASDGNLTAARPLCEVIAFLAQQSGRHIQDALGKSLGTNLLRFFLNSANTLLLRRWASYPVSKAGLLLYELCRTSESTVELLVGQKTTTASQLNGLGRIVQLQDDREDLMLVSCMIMSELAHKNVDQRLLWPGQTEGATFVRGNSQEWMVGLQTVLDGFSESQASHASMFYPHAIHADQDLFFDEQKGRLLMLMEDRLTVVVAPPAALHTFYVDIPFENIHGVAILPELEVRLELVSTSGSWTYVVNAEPYRTEVVSIELSTAAQAQHVLEEVRQRCNLGRASYRQGLRSARSSSAALMFDGTPRSDDMDVLPPSTSVGAAEEPLQPHDEPAMIEAKLDAVHDELAPGTGLKDQVPEQQNISDDMSSGDEEQGHDEVDQVAAVSPPELAINDLGRIAKENAARLSPKDTKTRTKDESSIYNLPEESPGPTLRPEQPRKSKGKGDGGATQPAPQPAPQPRKRESKGKPSQGRKRQSGQKRKPEESESDNSDDNYRPRQEQRASRKASGRVTRASAARKLDANGRQSGGPTVSEQVAETVPKPRNGLPPVQQSADGIKQEAHTSIAKSKARHQSASHQTQHHPSEPIDWKRQQLLPPRDRPIEPKSEEEAPADNEHYVTHSEVEGGVGNERPAILSPEIVKTIAVNKKMHVGKPRLDQKQDSFPGAGKSQQYAMIVSSDESDISSSGLNESSQLKSNVKQSEHYLEKQDKESHKHGTRSTGEPVKQVSTPKDDPQETQAAQCSETKKTGTLRNGSRRPGSADAFEERSVLTSLSKAGEQSNSAGRRGLLDERISGKSPVQAYDLKGMHDDEGSYSTRKTPDPTKLVRTTYSSGKSRKRQERDKFGSLIEEEEHFSKATLAPASLLPSKRSARLDIPQGGERRQTTGLDEDKMENSVPAMILETRIKKYDNTSEPAGPKNATSLRLGDSVEDFGSVAAPAGLSSSSFIDQPISAAFEPESSPLARHSGRNARVSSVESEWKGNTPGQNQRQKRGSFDSGKPRVEQPLEGRPSSPKRAKTEVTSTPRNMHGTLPRSVKKVRHDGIMTVMEPAIEPGRMDQEPVVPSVLDQSRLISAKDLNNLQVFDAILQRDVGKVKPATSRVEPNVLDRSRIEGHSRPEKRQMGDSVARHDKEIIQRRRVEPQPKRGVSSNSKKMPEPPEADSKAITIHVPQRLLITSRSLQTPVQPLMDPFHGQASTPGRPRDETMFMRNLRKQMEENAKAARIKQDGGGRECADDDDPDRTLVDMIEDTFDMNSVEDKSSTAVVSSTDAEPNGHYEKMEWERSLKPHQRDLFDVLTRISRHFVRHLIDSETAIEDVLQDFEADGTHLIELMEETHRMEYDAQRKCLLEARTNISGALFHINDQVVEYEEQARTALLGNNWESEGSVSKEHIPHLEKMLNQMVDP